MCGLFGFSSSVAALDEATIARARTSLDQLVHRGPDQFGEFVHGGTYIGHRRLSILDLSDSGKQPMVANDGLVAIAVNGEIYNYAALRQELGEHSFTSHSDSEVVLHGYRQWGMAKLLDRLEGMYAAVVWDRAARKVFLFRDRLGIKPLYYACRDGQLSWGSELKALVAHYGSSNLHIDNTALFDFLTYRYIPSPKTLYKGLQKLEPAHYLEYSIDTGKTNVTEYWSLPCERDHRVSMQEAAERVAHSVEASVVEQMMSDVPVGFFLSGGMDSSVVVSAAVAAHVNAQAFSIGFDAKEHDETAYAALLAKQLQVQHHIRRLTSADATDLVSWMQSMFDEPFADTSALATYKLAQFAKEHVTVALSGDGGDELFGGYLWYERFQRFSTASKLFGCFLPSTLRDAAFVRHPTQVIEKVRNRALVLAQRDPVAMFQTLVPGLSAGERDPYRSALDVPKDYDALWSFRRFYRPELGPMKSLQYLDLKTFLPDDVLTKVDRTTMAVSLEARVPLLATPLVELAFSLPDAFHFQRGQLKAGLKAAFKAQVPEQILNRPKKGFGLPTHAWRAQVMGQHFTFSEAMLSKRYGVAL